MEDQISDYKMRVEEHVRSINELTISKNKLASESSDNAQRLEDAESKVKPLTKGVRNVFERPRVPYMLRMIVSLKPLDDYVVFP